jgi:enamine deaminase RidA (YjgF/YER057c/UK114 family)
MSNGKGSFMTIKRLHVGPRMSQVVIHGGVAYLAGQVAANTKGKSVTEQTKDILAAIDGLLKEAGTSKAKLLTAQIWLTDMKTFGDMNAVWDAWVSPGNTPARATVQSPALAAPGYDVEIMVTAAL